MFIVFVIMFNYFVIVSVILIQVYLLKVINCCVSYARPPLISPLVKVFVPKGT